MHGGHLRIAAHIGEAPDMDRIYAVMLLLLSTKTTQLVFVFDHTKCQLAVGMRQTLFTVLADAHSLPLGHAVPASVAPCHLTAGAATPHTHVAAC